MTLPLERALWETSVQTGPGAKLAAAYELPWFFRRSVGCARAALVRATSARPSTDGGASEEPSPR
jgi:hypothetical protein